MYLLVLCYVAFGFQVHVLQVFNVKVYSARSQILFWPCVMQTKTWCDANFLEVIPGKSY